MSASRIYLDHAATSWPKNDAVLKAMDEFARHCGAAAGRGSYRSSLAASEVLTRVRTRISQRVGAPSPDCISFHSGGTSALNAAIHGMVGRFYRDDPGQARCHVVTSAAEHNSVLRPLHYLAQRKSVRLTIVPVDRVGRVDANRLLEQVQPETAIVALTSASNVTGVKQPVAEVGRALADHPAALLCDAAQSFGWTSIDVAADHIDLLACPGHKASGGPAGTGFLYVSPHLHRGIQPSIQGGTGSVSESLEMPATFPEKMEAGNLNVPAIAGWQCALDLECPKQSDHNAPALDASPTSHDHGYRLAERMHHGLGSIDGVTLLGQPGEIPIASFKVDRYRVGDVATILDAEFGIEVRSGLHCAALIHAHIGSASDGTVRMSAGPETRFEEIDAAIDAVRQIAQGG